MLHLLGVTFCSCFFDSCLALGRDMAPCGARLDAPEKGIGDIDAWRPDTSMPGCSIGMLAGLAGWLGWLTGWLGWLDWLADGR